MSETAPRRRRKHHDSELGKDKDSPRKDKDREKRKSSRSTRKTSSKDADRETPTRDKHRNRSPHSIKSRSTSHRVSSVPEVDRHSSLTSPNSSRISLPYPNFSRAHSKEAVGAPSRQASPFSPDSTDLRQDNTTIPKEHSGDIPQVHPPPQPTHPPPSPPLTAVDPDSNSPRSAKKIHEDSVADTGSQVTSDLRYSTSGSTVQQGGSRHNASQITADTEQSAATTVRDKLPRTNVDHTRSLSPNTRPPGQNLSRASSRKSALARSATDSDATSIATERRTVRNVDNISRGPSSNREQSSLLSESFIEPQSAADGNALHISTSQDRKQTASPIIEIIAANDPVIAAAEPFGGLPPPPPPPPPAMVTTPRVDYLLQNGGLTHPVSRNMIAAVFPQAATTGLVNGSFSSPRIQNYPASAAQSVFGPFQSLLESYNQVLSKNGSIAVATGYRSVARRLLDRLEAVFARNISSEVCTCIMCQSTQEPSEVAADDTGVGWGEILEYVSGRRDLPPWPPFSISASVDLGIHGLSQKPPMQTLDIDVPEEFREHYIRQSKKTKVAVRNWLASQPEEPSSAPQEIDDETLTFAILTHLEPEKRQKFTALMKDMGVMPASRAPTPLNTGKNEMLSKTALALQRLYRLAKPPRNAECTIYLLNNPDLHVMLATLAAVSNGEWDILTSGRFDGFLWGGAENGFPRGPSRGPTATPLSQANPAYSSLNGRQSRGPTPAPSSFGAPVQMDEEAEIAVLAEVEREIYGGMEALEDAFEALHCRAEVVRRALRERSAGLAMAAQARRGSEVEVRMGTPASMSGIWGDRGYDSEEDGFDDGRSELAPDDSASNIGFHKSRRPHRRTERNTPAPVEEEDESGD